MAKAAFSSAEIERAIKAARNAAKGWAGPICVELVNGDKAVKVTLDHDPGTVSPSAKDGANPWAKAIRQSAA